jgi:Terminase small subunit
LLKWRFQQRGKSLGKNHERKILIMKRNHGLTDKQHAFCLEFINNHGNASAAYQFVYPKAKKRTAEVEGSKWLKKPDIHLRISDLRAAVRKRLEDKAIHTQEAKIARAEAVMNAAEEKGKFSAFATILRLQCELLGYIKNKEATVIVRSIDALSKEELDAEEKRINEKLAGLASFKKDGKKKKDNRDT